LAATPRGIARHAGVQFFLEIGPLSHKLRAPLNAVIGFTGTLLLKARAAQRRRREIPVSSDRARGASGRIRGLLSKGGKALDGHNTRR
jgi:signal transduction histidine kinase